MSISEAIRNWFNEPILRKLNQMEAKQMAQEQDLQAGISAVGQQLARLQGDVTAIIDRLKNSQSGIPDADIQALSSVAAGIGVAADSIEAAINPPTPPAAA